MKNTFKAVSLILLVILVVGLLASCSGEEQQEKYTVYFGLNDASTGTQVLTVDEAKERIRALWVEKGMGYTEYITYGAYVEDGKVNENDTLVYELFFAEKAEVEAVVAKAKQQLQLAGVLISVESSTAYFAE